MDISQIEGDIINSEAPLHKYKIKDLNQFAENEGIDINKLTLKGHIYKRIRETLLGRQGTFGHGDTVDQSGSDTPEELNKMRVSELKIMAKNYGLSNSGVKALLIERIQGYYQELSLLKVHRNVIHQHEHDVNDMLSFYKELLGGKRNPGNVSNILEKLEKIPYVDCSWLETLGLTKLGSGAAGDVFRDNQGYAYKIIRYFQYIHYTSVLFVEKLNYMLDNASVGDSVPFTRVYYMRKCNNTGSTTSSGDVIVEIQEEIVGRSYANFMDEYKRTKQNVEAVRSLLAQVVLSIMWLMYNKMAHFDLHSDNIIITRTNDEYFTLTIGNKRYTLPTHGYTIKIIDYDIVGIIFRGDLYKSSKIPVKNILTISDKSISELPGYFMLSMLSRILFDESTPLYIVGDNPIVKLIEAVDGGKSVMPNVVQMSRAVHEQRYTVENYNNAYAQIYINAENMVMSLIPVNITTI
jgi:serine/threonine protein kinase